MKKIIFLLMAAVIVFFAYGKVFSQNFVTVTRTNQKQTIKLPTGQVLEIQLPRKASTGYVWCESFNSSDKSVKKSIAQVGESEFIHDSSPSILKNKKKGKFGQPETQVIRYAGVSQGITILTLELRRPWLKDGEVIDSYTITVVSEGKYAGSYTPSVKAVRKYDKPLTSMSSTLPTSWDWRTECTPITNQGSCGDCWAYASCGTLECNIKIKDNVTTVISEEFITDCYTDNGCLGCNGGYCAHQAWMASYTGANTSGGGAIYNSEDPTTCNSTGQTGTCGAPYAPYQTIDSYRDIGGENTNGVPPVDSIKNGIYNYGPVWIGADASTWSSYSGGILCEKETDDSSNVDHAIVLVGWKDTTVSDNSGGYWIVRNSWGLGWGINGTGYMYLSYGSDVVGCMADYLVYKGGTPHNIPPVASFAVSDTASCTGNIQFTDQSVNFPTTWSWSFGDGGTSTLQNPSYTYTANGTYTVSLVAINAYGNDTLTKTSLVTIDMPPAPTVQNGGTWGGGTATLYAWGPDTLNWYNAPTGGTLVNTGGTYIVSPVDSLITFYVEDDIPHTFQAVGMLSSTLSSSTGGYYTSSGKMGLVFTTYSPVTIKSVDVYAATSVTRTIYLENSAGTTLNSLTKSIASGHQTVTLNFNVPAGADFILACSPSNNLWRETTDASYPYTIPGLISITGNTVPDAAHYYYFYNWQVAESPCTSPRVPVSADVTPGIKDFSGNESYVYPNPNDGKFQVSSPKSQVSGIAIYNLLGEMIYSLPITDNRSPITVNIANYSSGVYMLEVKTANGISVQKIVKE